MSAPKPRVHWDALNQRWATQCDGCRIKGWETSWSATLAMAVEHSRTHTAERVADEFARLSGNALDKASLGSRFSGVAYAFAKADALVRKHLVTT